MTIVDIVNKMLALGIVISQIGIVALVIYLIFFRKIKNVVTDFIGSHGLLLAFMIALVSTLGSLFYSQIAGFEPCDLCWFQRLLMYPLTLLIALALVKKSSKILNYALWFSVAGFLVALYHNYVYYSQDSSFCRLFGVGISCAKRYVFEFGYVTIPMMAITGFALILLLLLFQKMYLAQSNETKP